MTARERILAIKLLEKLERNPEYANKIGIHVSIETRDPQTEERNTFRNNYLSKNK